MEFEIRESLDGIQTEAVVVPIPDGADGCQLETLLEGLEDFLWALLNCREFVTNH